MIILDLVPRLLRWRPPTQPRPRVSVYAFGGLDISIDGHRLRHLAAGAIPRDLVVGHYNDDADPDLAVANLESDEITIHLADGTGGFADAISLPTNGAADSLTTADFNLDGRQDLAFISGQQPDVQVLLRDPDGGFGFARRIQVVDPSLLTAGSPPSFLVASDVDLDGREDLVTGNPGWGGLVVLAGDGLGGFSSPQFVVIADEGPASAVVANVDREAAPEIAVVTHQARRVLLLRRADDGSYELASETTVASPSADDVSGPEDSAGIATEDFDGDGALDLITSNVDSASVTILMNGCRPGG